MSGNVYCENKPPFESNLKDPTVKSRVFFVIRGFSSLTCWEFGLLGYGYPLWLSAMRNEFESRIDRIT